MATDSEVEWWLSRCSGLGGRPDEEFRLNLDRGVPEHRRGQPCLLWVRVNCWRVVTEYGLVHDMDGVLRERERLVLASDGLQDIVVVATKSDVQAGMTLDEILANS